MEQAYEEETHSRLEAKLDLLLEKVEGLEQIATSLENFEARAKVVEDLIDVSLPIASEAAVAVNGFAQESVDKGYVHFIEMLIRVVEATIPRWTLEEIDRFGEHMASIIAAMMEMSEPTTLKHLEKAGMMTVMKDISRKEVREGLAFLTHFLHLAHPGRGNEAYGKGLSLNGESEYKE